MAFYDFAPAIKWFLIADREKIPHKWFVDLLCLETLAHNLSYFPDGPFLIKIYYDISIFCCVINYVGVVNTHRGNLTWAIFMLEIDWVNQMKVDRLIKSELAGKWGEIRVFRWFS